MPGKIKYVDTKCRQCGKTYQANEWRVRKGLAKFCSPACKVESQRNKITVPCARCGTPITVVPSRAKEGLTCGYDCRNRLAAANRREPVQFDGDTVRIPLTKGKWATVDRADYDAIPELRDESWITYETESGHGTTYYAFRRDNDGGPNVFMHRLIMNAIEGEEVNHRDFDGLNNRRSNIEICSRSNNMEYRRKIPTWHGRPCTSHYKGVSFEPKRGKWRSQLNTQFLGRFDTEEEAAEAYNEAARAAYGQFAHLNEIDG